MDVTGYDEAARLSIVRLSNCLADPWRGYVPTPPMSSFHLSLAINRYVIAASQVGKTMGGAREAWMYATLTHPYRTVPSSARYGIIAVGSLDGTAYTGVLKAMWNTRPHHLIDWSKTKWLGETSRPTNDTIWLKNGHTIRFVSSRGGSTGAAGIQADWIWIDEPAKQDRFSELIARTTQTEGHIWLTFTAVDTEQDLTWLKLYLEGDADNNVPPESPGWEKHNMELSVDSCPWMTQSQVDAVEAKTPAWIADQRLKGKWDSPPTNGYFNIDYKLHDLAVPFYTVDCTVGPWVALASADHGELAGHEHVVFILARKVKPAAGPTYAHVAVVGEYVSSKRTTVDEDAAGIKRELSKIANHIADYKLGDLRVGSPGGLANPAAWDWTGDINSSGKAGDAGESINEALERALGLRKGAIKTPNKRGGTVTEGRVRIRTALTQADCPIRLAGGATGQLGAPQLIKSMMRHVGKDDNTKHAVDALRYGVYDYLEAGSREVRDLPDPVIPSPFSRWVS